MINLKQPSKSQSFFSESHSRINLPVTPRHNRKTCRFCGVQRWGEFPETPNKKQSFFFSAPSPIKRPFRGKRNTLSQGGKPMISIQSPGRFPVCGCKSATFIPKHQTSRQKNINKNEINTQITLNQSLEETKK